MNVYNLLKGLLKVAAKNDVRFYLNAIHVTPLEMRAADGRMAVIVKRETGLPSDRVDGVLLCRKDLETKLKMFTAKSELALTFSPDGKAYLNEYELSTVDGRYPDLTRATGRQREGTSSPTRLDAKLVSALCGAVATIFANERHHGAEFNTVGPQAGLRITRGNVDAYLMPCRL